MLEHLLLPGANVSKTHHYGRNNFVLEGAKSVLLRTILLPPQENFLLEHLTQTGRPSLDL